MLGVQRANDVKSYRIILETLFKGRKYTFENDLAQKIKDEKEITYKLNDLKILNNFCHVHEALSMNLILKIF